MQRFQIKRNLVWGFREHISELHSSCEIYICACQNSPYEEVSSPFDAMSRAKVKPTTTARFLLNDMANGFVCVSVCVWMAAYRTTELMRSIFIERRGG